MSRVFIWGKFDHFVTGRWFLNIVYLPSIPSDVVHLWLNIFTKCSFTNQSIDLLPNLVIVQCCRSFFFVWFDELIRSIDRSIDRGILHWRMGRRNNNVICPLIRFMNWVSCLIATFFNDRIRSHIIVSPVYVRARKLYPYWQVTISNWILKYIYIWIYIYWIYIYGRLVWYDRSVGWFVLSLHFYDFECNLCVWPYATLDWIGLDWSFWC